MYYSCVTGYQGMLVEDRRQLCIFGAPLLPLCGFWELNLGYLACVASLLVPDPSFDPNSNHRSGC